MGKECRLFYADVQNALLIKLFFLISLLTLIGIINLASHLCEKEDLNVVF